MPSPDSPHTFYSFFTFHSTIVIFVCFVLLASFCAPGYASPTNPVPFIDILAPVSIAPGSTGVTLTVVGANFVASSTVQWNGIALATTFVTAKKLTAVVPDAFVAAPGQGTIKVFSPAPRGGTSNVMHLPVMFSIATPVFPSSPSSTVTVGGSPEGIATADTTGNGKIDLAVANFHGNSVSVPLDIGNGTFSPVITTGAFGNGPTWIVTGDFNEDGKLDMAVTNQNSGGSARIVILTGNGTGTFATGSSLTSGVSPYTVVTGDFNADGHLDLAVTNNFDNTVTVFLE